MSKWYLPMSFSICVLPEVDCWTKILVQVAYFGYVPKKLIKANLRGKERTHKGWIIWQVTTVSYRLLTPFRNTSSRPQPRGKGTVTFTHQVSCITGWECCSLSFINSLNFWYPVKKPGREDMVGVLICSTLHYKYFEGFVCKHGRNKEMRNWYGGWVQNIDYFTVFLR